MSKRRSRRRNRPALEALERREVPATWGIPWADPQHLTISFAPDGTNVMGESSDLFAMLDSQLGAGGWEQTILKAVQTWASTADINVGLVSDGGEPIGAAGAAEGDPRFGDIRISAAPMAPGVLAVGTPYDPATGTLSGDVILNSNDDFNPGDPGSYDLYTVLLHEFGHSFGFADSSDPSSFMYNVYGGPVTGLAPGASAAMQGLYGAPVPDPSEVGPGNPGNTTPEALSGQQGVVTAAATLSSDQDHDAFAYKTASGVSYAAGLDIRVQTAGISLLDPTVTVLGASGQVLGSASASGPLDGGVSLHVGGIAAGSTYEVEVSGSGDVFGVGAFELDISPTNASSPVVGGQHVAATALVTDSLLGTLAGTGTISPGSTAGLYSFTSPLLTLLGGSISLQTWGVGIGRPEVTVYNASMRVVAQAVASGTSDDLSFNVALAPLSKYYIEVDDAPTTDFGIGNYELQVGFSGLLGLVSGLVDGVVDDVVSAVVPTTPAKSSSLSAPIALTPSPIAGERVVSSLTPSIPQAVYQVTPPSAASGATEYMTVSVVTLDDQGVTPVVSVFDNKGNPVACQVLAAEGGAYVVQVPCSPSVPSYLVQIKGGMLGLTAWTGDYYLDATFGTAAAAGQTFFDGPNAESAALALSDDELYRFVLTAGAGAIGTGDEVTITDASGDVVAQQYVAEGQSASLTLLMDAGNYTIAVAPTGASTLSPPPSLLLVGFGLSDPIKAYSTGGGSSSTTGSG